MAKSFDVETLLSGYDDDRIPTPVRPPSELQPFYSPSATPYHSTEYMTNFYISMDLQQRFNQYQSYQTELQTELQSELTETETSSTLTELLPLGNQIPEIVASKQDCSTGSDTIKPPLPKAHSNKKRQTFTQAQLEILEQEYLRNTYLPRARRMALIHQLNLSEKQIVVWFQNRRVKEKKSCEKHKNCCGNFQQIHHDQCHE